MKGDVLSGFFTTDAAVIQKGYAYLKGFAPVSTAVGIVLNIGFYIYLERVGKKRNTL